MDVTKEEGYKEILKKQLTVKRYEHSLAVAQMAAKLAGMFNGDVQRAYMAGLMHDYAKDMSQVELLEIAQDNDLIQYHMEIIQPKLLHGIVGAFLLQEQGLITDEDVLQAIRYHTTGHPEMNLLGRILYVADYIEPGRTFTGVEKMRQVAYKKLDFGVLTGIDHTLAHLIQSGMFIHPLAIETRNRLLEEMNIKHCN